MNTTPPPRPPEHPRYIGTCVVCRETQEGPDYLGEFVRCYACLNWEAREELRQLRQRKDDADDFYRDFLRWADEEDPYPTRKMLETRARAALRRNA